MVSKSSSEIFPPLSVEFGITVVVIASKAVNSTDPGKDVESSSSKGAENMLWARRLNKIRTLTSKFYYKINVYYHVAQRWKLFGDSRTVFSNRFYPDSTIFVNHV